MRASSVRYRWRVVEAGGQLHDALSLADAFQLRATFGRAETTIKLVRTTPESHTCAMLRGRKLPSHFSNGVPVPRKFHNECRDARL